jgi:MFS family permease
VPQLSALSGIVANSATGYTPSGFVDQVSTATTPDTRARQGMNLALATWVSAINFWAWNMIGPLSTMYAGDLSLSSTEASMLVATPILVGSVGRIFVGALTDRFCGRSPGWCTRSAHRSGICSGRMWSTAAATSRGRITW